MSTPPLSNVLNPCSMHLSTIALTSFVVGASSISTTELLLISSYFYQGKFEVYHSATGAQGQWETASKAQLENDLSSKNKDDAVIKVLKEGNNRTAKGVGRTKESAVKK